MKKKLLVIGYTFPEPDTTAAGSRLLQILSLFQHDDCAITFATTAQKSEHSVAMEAYGITAATILLNDPSFDTFISELNPSVVLFDRFITEEQFGWRVAEQVPQAMRILDTEDLHFLRKARAEVVKKGGLPETAKLHTDIAKREIASMYRCDVSLIISEVEMDLLQSVFNFPKQLLYYLPFLVTVPSEVEKMNGPSFEQRQHFMTIGNFKHAPNVDAVHYLKLEIWPLIRKQLPSAQLHIFGAYATQQITQMHNEREGFLIKGWSPDLTQAFQQARVCLAPLRFGAGLKGKLLDAMRCGTPSVTTSIGAEGMFGETAIPGAIEDTASNFVNAAVNLYQNKAHWLQSQQNGFEIIENRFEKSLFSNRFREQLTQWLENLETHRQNNFVGQLLQHHTMQSTKYLSKWIEAKGKL